jgi:nucleosome binding factor SPN SPT16 subunit
LKAKKLEELQERMHEQFGADMKKQKTIEVNKLECYKQKEDLPKDLKPRMIYIDHRSNSILLPINGQHVPFHICILKSVVKNDEGKNASLRFNFHLPNTVATLNFPKYTEPTIYIKELVFRSQQINRIT